MFVWLRLFDSVCLSVCGLFVHLCRKRWLGSGAIRTRSLECISHGRSLKFARRPGGVCCCPVTAYVRISSWTAYVLLVLLAQSQWRTLRSAGWYVHGRWRVACIERHSSLRSMALNGIEGGSQSESRTAVVRRWQRRSRATGTLVVLHHSL